jgi:hypothetical protein
MDKFYFDPSRAELAGMLGHLFAPHLSGAQVGRRARGRACLPHGAQGGGTVKTSFPSMEDSPPPRHV